MDFDIALLSEKVIYIVFTVMLCGAGFFNLILLRQLSLMHRVLTTPFITVFRLMAWISLFLVVGLIFCSLAFLIF